MILPENIIERLSEYVENNEVVYQFCGELVEVSNDENPNNRLTLVESLAKVSNVGVYNKGTSDIHESFEELDDWSTENDCLFLLVPVGLLLCIPKTIAIDANLLIEK
ncbi:MAG: hypothetical protein BWX72_00251 [Firmicutes bacterium ADurb.Bin080]|jgi:hypothetical protein|nr:MAG: hypothetical protein BWX72_00251 [Firmicutes bacterium ADurb.Bin080]